MQVGEHGWRKRKKKVCGDQETVYEKEEIGSPQTSGFRRKREK